MEIAQRSEAGAVDEIQGLRMEIEALKSEIRAMAAELARSPRRREHGIVVPPPQEQGRRRPIRRIAVVGERQPNPELVRKLAAAAAKVSGSSDAK